MFQSNILLLSSGWNSKPGKKQTEASSKLSWYLTWLTLRSWRWQQYVARKCCALSELQSLTGWQTIFFMLPNKLLAHVSLFSSHLWGITRKLNHWCIASLNMFFSLICTDRLCGLVVRVPGYRSRGLHLIPGATLTTRHPLSAKVHTNFADKRQSLGQYSSLVE
jgi:hypothetical protein